jgi:hypothetical protein
MSEFTFTGVHIADLTFTLDEQEIWNDILAIVGEPGVEILVRGIDMDSSIPKYGQRSKRLPVPLGADQSTVESLVTEGLDRFTGPVPNVEMFIIGDTDEKREQILTRQVSDKITIQLPVMYLDQDFVIDGIDKGVDSEKVLTATYQLTGLRSNE